MWSAVDERIAAAGSLIAPAARVADEVVDLVLALPGRFKQNVRRDKILLREVASSLVDVYLSSASTRMNEIMKVLTIIATIFIPLSFVASLYGMNFDPKVSPWNMPELDWYLGYPFALALMALIAGGLIWYFHRKGWMGWRRRRKP